MRKFFPTNRAIEPKFDGLSKICSHKNICLHYSPKFLFLFWEEEWVPFFSYALLPPIRPILPLLPILSSKNVNNAFNSFLTNKWEFKKIN